MAEREGLAESGGGMQEPIAWAVHLLTASGAAWAFLATLAAARGNWQLVFILNGVAMIVDGIDGTFARKFNVKKRLPWFDGAALDFVVDYANYVFIAAIVLAGGGLLSEPFATGAGLVVAVVGALYFADTRMKTADQSFRGFPAIWNFVVFVLMVYQPPQIVTLAVIAVCAVLTFIPVEFIHPMRVKRWQVLTLAVTLAWAVLGVIIVVDDLRPGTLVLIVFAAANIYLAGIGFVLQLTRRA